MKWIRLGREGKGAILSLFANRIVRGCVEFYGFQNLDGFISLIKLTWPVIYKNPFALRGIPIVE